MNIGELYVKMGELSLYELRDKLLVWRTENGFNLKTEITDDILGIMPDEFIRETFVALKKLELVILEKLSGESVMLEK